MRRLRGARHTARRPANSLPVVVLVVLVVLIILVVAAASLALPLPSFRDPSSVGERIPDAHRRVEVLDRTVDSEAGDSETGNSDVTATSGSGVTVTAEEEFLSTSSFLLVDEEIATLTRNGTELGFVLLDLETGRGLTYDADTWRYPASCIKAAYCTMLLENEGTRDGAPRRLIEECLVNSSNDAYDALFATYGLPAFSSWLTEHGAPEAGANARNHQYPSISPQELSAVWQEIWRFGTSDEPGALELAGYLGRSNHSPLGELLREGGSREVWSKPGWYPQDEYDIASTNDAGVVFSPSGPYVLVVMTDISADLHALTPLIGALDAAHAEMCP